MHYVWKNNLLGLSPSNKGDPSIEIDESKIIGNSGKVSRMLGLIDKNRENTGFSWVLDNRTHEYLLILVCQNVVVTNV